MNKNARTLSSFLNIASQIGQWFNLRNLTVDERVIEISGLSPYSAHQYRMVWPLTDDPGYSEVWPRSKASAIIATKPNGISSPPKIVGIDQVSHPQNFWCIV